MRITNRVEKRLNPRKIGFKGNDLQSSLHKLVIGQNEAITEIVNTYQTYMTGLASQEHPIGNFLFLGPTGSGKTRMVEALAEVIIGTSKAVIKIDCAEFQRSHEIAKLIGSPPGYLGHRETHPVLSQETLNQYHNERAKMSFLLFDEIEKASDALWNLLLGILDKATLTLGDNRRVDFSKTFIFMTSNLGASEMSSITNPKMGFERPQITLRTDKKIERSGLEAARKKFTPEFMNRLDKIIVFKTLEEPQLRRILDIELDMVQRRIFSASERRAFIFYLTPEAKETVLREGIDRKYGARHLKRAIERLVVQPISNLIATNQLNGGDQLRIESTADGTDLDFIREEVGLTTMTMENMISEGNTFVRRASR